MEHQVIPFFRIFLVQHIESVRSFLHVDSESAHAAAGTLCLCGIQCSVWFSFDGSIDLRNNTVRHLEALCNLFFLQKLFTVLFFQSIFPHLVHLQCQGQNILSMEDRKRRWSDGWLTEVITSIHPQALGTSAALGCHKSQIRYTVMLLTPVITVLLFEVIAALGRYQEIRFLIIAPFILVFIASKQLQPPLLQLHVGVFLPATIFSGFTSYDGMPDCLILLWWVLQQLNLRCHFLWYHRKSKFLYHPSFRPELPIISSQRWYPDDPQCPMHPLDWLVLQHGCTHARCIDMADLM